jgi:hypothetical protein
VLCSFTWDASLLGWAAVAWDLAGPLPALMELLFIGTWPDDWPVAVQAHCEILALASETFVRSAGASASFATTFPLLSQLCGRAARNHPRRRAARCASRGSQRRLRWLPSAG